MHGYLEHTLKLVDIDISELKSVARRGRARSEETTQLVEAIDGLKSGAAKGIVIANLAEAKKVRARLLYAARIAGKRLQIAEKDSRVLFAVAGRARKRHRRGS